MPTEPRPTIIEAAMDAASRIDAVLIDPAHRLVRLVRLVRLPTLPSHGGSHGAQIDR